MIVRFSDNFVIKIYQLQEFPAVSYTIRTTESADLPHCLEIVRHDLPLHVTKDGEASALLDLWVFLMDHQMAVTTVLEDTVRRKIVGFGMSVFVTPSFAMRCQSRRTDSLLVELLHLWETKRSPILPPRAIAAANSPDSGLYLCGLHSSWRGKFDRYSIDGEDQTLYIRDKMLETLHHMHQGYYLVSYFKEIYGSEELQRYLRFGMTRWGSAGFSPIASAPPDDHPSFIIGITRAEALTPEREQCFARPLFASYIPPRFRLTSGQKQQIILASSGLSDSEIAERTGRSVEAVNRMWSRIYERVDDVMVPLLSASPLGNNKRQKLLSYIANHPEEIRPY